MSENAVRGRRILVVEDEYMIADELVEELTAAGAMVVGPAPDVNRAMTLLASEAAPDAAVLDVNLGGEPVFPLADDLRERGVPFVFTTGYDHAALPDRFAKALVCEKPFDPAKVEAAIASLFTN